MFSSKRFIVVALKVRSLIHFELLFIHDVREKYSFILLHVDIWRRPGYWERLKAKEKGA